MTQPIVILGAGGFARETFDVIDAVNRQAEEGGSAPEFEVLGFLDDGRPDLTVLEPYGVDHLGPVRHLEELPTEVGYLIGIASPTVKRKLDAYASGVHRAAPVLVHPNVHIGRAVTFAPGVIVCSHVSIMNNIRFGRHVHVSVNCTVGHDGVLEDYATVSPLVAISGNVTLGEGAMIGTGASINPGITIGAGAVVGSGAAAVHDIEPGVTAVGVPALPR